MDINEIWSGFNGYHGNNKESKRILIEHYSLLIRKTVVKSYGKKEAWLCRTRMDLP